MKKLLLLLVAILLSSCANKSMTRYEELAPTLEKKGFDATISQVKKKQNIHKTKMKQQQIQLI